MAKTPEKPQAPNRSSGYGVFDPFSRALRASFMRQSGSQEPPKGSSPPAGQKKSSTGKASSGKPSAAKSAGDRAAPAGRKVYPRSPLAPKGMPEMDPIAGMKLATAQTGMKYKGRDDLLLAVFDEGTAVAGVFTRSTMASAPVEWSRANIAKHEDAEARVLLVNAGNSNAFTGKAGTETVKAVAASLASEIDCRRRDVFLASTGVIGVPFDAAALTAHIPKAAAKVQPGGFDAAAKAIATTDTFPKAATAKAMIDGAEVTIHGIAKGSGMIAPDMATMLAFLFTDAKIPSPVLQTLLLLSVRETFNCVTVDNDMSTSDTVLLFATGKGPQHKPVTRPGDARLGDFRAKLMEVMEDLAKQVARDGEGASKFITVRVSGAESARSARSVAFAIGNSPLVKTAIAGEDANWGRIVMAVGKSGEPADRDKLAIRIGGNPVASKGGVDPDYNEKDVSAAMRAQEIDIEVDLGVGSGEARIWTCDLTHGYISINTDYRS